MVIPNNTLSLLHKTFLVLCRMIHLSLDGYASTVTIEADVCFKMNMPLLAVYGFSLTIRQPHDRNGGNPYSWKDNFYIQTWPGVFQ